MTMDDGRLTTDLAALLAEFEAEGAARERWAWSPAQEAVLRQWYGRLPLAEVVERVSRVLRRETGVTEALRTKASVNVRAGQLAIRAYQGEAGEVSLYEAARLAGELAEHHTLDEAYHLGLLRTRRAGKQRYVSLAELARFLVDYRERLLDQEGILEALDQTEVISKKEGMALTGLSETHFSRYLQTGVIRAWKLPTCLGSKQGIWLVERESVAQYMRVKREGRLNDYLQRFPRYQARQKRLTAQIGALRRAGRLGRRDPLTRPKSVSHPGCFTVAQVASHTGLTTRRLYELIDQGQLEAVCRRAHSRLRYAIRPAVAWAFVEGLGTATDD